jgi:carbon starvation protein
VSTLLIALGSFVGFIVAYHTYGRWLSRKIFRLDPTVRTPAHAQRDDTDFVPTNRFVLFGHHFTSIAGTGPIVGPAIAVFWGWLPALLWVLFGSVFLGAVQDLSALVISLRNEGSSVGEVAGRMISPRAKVFFLFILAMLLMMVIAVFGLVIAAIFSIYPESVLGVWISLPIAIMVGLWVHNRNGNILLPSILALLAIYFCVYLGAYHFPFTLPSADTFLPSGIANYIMTEGNAPVIVWTGILLVYCFFASVLPVWLLLQPRDFVNSHQLIVAMVILTLGLAVASFSGQASLFESTPAVVSAEVLPDGAPPIFPFLFIVVACGAISGFHSLVSSGTSSKQLNRETDAQLIGYGSMLLEGALAVMVIAACCAGVGMGKFERVASPTVSSQYTFQQVEVDGKPLVGRAAWEERYDKNRSWSSFSLGSKIGAFVEGGANFVGALGVPLKMAMGIMAVLVACFAATTLDTATRLQRYILQELARTVRFKPLENKYLATLVAVVTAGCVAMLPGPSGKLGTGGLILWPLFGAGNQLLAGMALLVAVFYLWRNNRPVWFIILPTIFLLVMPAWAMLWQMFHIEQGWWANEKYLLFTVGSVLLLLEGWLVLEGLLIFRQAKLAGKSLPSEPNVEEDQ